MYNLAKSGDSDIAGVNISGLINSTQQLFMTMLTVTLAMPKLIIDFYLSSIESLFATLTYHVRYWMKEPATFQGGKFIILGSDSTFGRAFTNQIVKRNGIVICVDSDEDRGKTLVKALNDSLQNTLAFFYRCDVHNEAEVIQVIDKINKDHQELSVLINAAEYKSLVPTYFEVYNHVLRAMQKNQKGKLVFIRTLDKGPRDAIMALYSQVNEELRETGNKNVSTLLAHVYPNITSEEARASRTFGYIKPDEAASTILEGLAKNRSVIYTPTFMVYLAFYLNFLPGSLAQAFEGVLFADKDKIVARREIPTPASMPMIK